jgi:hypothetical protein
VIEIFSRKPERNKNRGKNIHRLIMIVKGSGHTTNVYTIEAVEQGTEEINDQRESKFSTL